MDDGKIDLKERKKTIDEVFEALKAILKIDHVTTLIASFPHISFTHDSVCVSHDKTYASFKEVSPEERQSWVDTWKVRDSSANLNSVCFSSGLLLTHVIAVRGKGEGEKGGRAKC